MSNKRQLDVKNIDSTQDKVLRENYLTFKVFLAGALSGIICAIALQPLDVLKTRLQTPKYAILKDPMFIILYFSGRHKSQMVNVFFHIKEHENIRMLWAGTVPTLIRGIPGGGIYFTVYDLVKDYLYPHRYLTTAESILVGMLSRSVTDTVVIPLSVLKTRAESGIYKYDGVFSGLKNIYVHEGWRGLTSGLIPVLARDVPMSGAYVMFYLQSEQMIPQELLQKYPFTIHASCAAVSGVLASIVTHPPDVIKTQMQLYPDKYPNPWRTIPDIYAKYGVKGYFQGLFPRLLKRTIFATVSWSLYENVKEHHYNHGRHKNEKSRINN